MSDTLFPAAVSGRSTSSFLQLSEALKECSLFPICDKVQSYSCIYAGSDPP